MGAQKGKDLLLKVHDGIGFVTVAGLRTRRLAFGTEAIDITHTESPGRWRELIAGAGVKRCSIAGRGLFKDAGSDARIRDLFFEGTIVEFEVTVPDFGRITGPFQVTGLDYGGEHDGEVTYELALESAGALTFTAI
jgi:TP901-1 family phage major tail protein